jgi:hypothetical protein
MTLATAFAMLVPPAVASASHHFVKISEVYPGSPSSPTSDFVELQMYSPGQNFFSSADLVLYSAAGNPTTIELVDVANGTSQRTLLAGTAQTETIFSLQADVESVNVSLTNNGGGVCLTSSVLKSPIDCVAWGTVTLPSAGLSAPAITDGTSLWREPTRGCNTLLEAGDDTNSSRADFSEAFSMPQPNSAAPTSSSCPNTTFTSTPEKRTKDRTPTFTMTGGDEYECKIDAEPFDRCFSPYRPGRQSIGEHRVQVRATEADGSRDGTPARFTWRIIPR